MIKWLTLFSTFFFGKLLTTSRGPTWVPQLIDSTFHEFRKLGLFFSLQMVCVLFFVGGGFLSIIEAASLYDANGAFIVSAMFFAGLIVAVTSLLGLVMLFVLTKPSVEKKNIKMSLFNKNKAASPLEDAATLLINEFIKHREEDRQKEAARAAAAAAAVPTRPTQDSVYKYGINEARELTNRNVANL